MRTLRSTLPKYDRDSCWLSPATLFPAQMKACDPRPSTSRSTRSGAGMLSRNATALRNNA